LFRFFDLSPWVPRFRGYERLRNGRIYLIPASEETRGHLTTGQAKLWKAQLQEFLQATPPVR
jgi:homoserine O-acetyltransferase